MIDFGLLASLFVDMDSLYDQLRGASLAAGYCGSDCRLFVRQAHRADVGCFGDVDIFCLCELHGRPVDRTHLLRGILFTADDKLLFATYIHGLTGTLPLSVSR